MKVSCVSPVLPIAVLLMAIGSFFIGVREVHAGDEWNYGYNDLVPCPSIYHRGAIDCESAGRNRDRLGAGRFDPALGQLVLESVASESNWWGVSVYVLAGSHGTIVLREEEPRSGAERRAGQGAGSVRSSQSRIAGDLAMRLNGWWRVQLSGAHMPLSSLPPAGGGVPGGCVDGSYYVFLYGGACATANVCDPEPRSVSQQMVSLIHRLRDVVLAEGDDAKSDAVGAVVELINSLRKDDTNSRTTRP